MLERSKKRLTKAEIAILDEQILDVLREDNPQSIRHNPEKSAAPVKRNRAAYMRCYRGKNKSNGAGWVTNKYEECHISPEKIAVKANVSLRTAQRVVKREREAWLANIRALPPSPERDEESEWFLCCHVRGEPSEKRRVEFVIRLFEAQGRRIENASCGASA